MAVSVAQHLEAERGVYYVVDLSADGDVAQVHLQAEALKGRLDWLNGFVGWHRTADVTVTFTNAGPPALGLTGGNGTLTGWQNHPDASNTEAAETIPITGLRFTATGASQRVRLYTGRPLAEEPYSAGTPA